MRTRQSTSAERSRLKLLGALAAGAATGGCLADFGENALQEPPETGPRQRTSPPAPAPKQGGEGGGGGGGGSH